MEATLTFPEIIGASDQLDTPPAIVSERAALAKADLAKIDLADVALARFGDWRGQVGDARKKLDGLVLDLSTQSKIDDAKSLRHTLIGKPRAAARATSKELKSKLSQVSKTVGTAEEQIVAEFDAVETLITPHIDKAQEAIDEAKRKKAEDEARQAAAEAERKAKHEDAITTITGYVEKARGIASERVAAGIAYVENIDVSPEVFEEFAERAAAAKEDTLAALRELLVARQIEEREAAERAEAERVRDAITAINAAVGDCVGAPVELVEQTINSINAIYGDETDPGLVEAREKAIVKIGSLLALAKAAALAPPPEPALEPSPAPEPEPEPDVPVEGGQLVTASVHLNHAFFDSTAVVSDVAAIDSTAMPVADSTAASAPETEAATASITPSAAEDVEPEHSTEPTLPLGEIKARLGFALTAEFVTSLGIEGQKIKSATLYSEKQFVELCDALMERIRLVRDDAANE